MGPRQLLSGFAGSGWPAIERRPAAAGDRVTLRARLVGLHRAVLAALAELDNADCEGYGGDAGARPLDHFWPGEAGRYFTGAASLLGAVQAAWPARSADAVPIDVTPRLTLDQNPDRPYSVYSRAQLQDLEHALARVLDATAAPSPGPGSTPDPDADADPGPAPEPLPGPDGELVATRLAGLALVRRELQGALAETDATPPPGGRRLDPGQFRVRGYFWPARVARLFHYAASSLRDLQAARPGLFGDLVAIDDTPRMTLGLDFVWSLPPHLDLDRNQPQAVYARHQLQGLLRDIEQVQGIVAGVGMTALPTPTSPSPRTGTSPGA